MTVAPPQRVSRSGRVSRPSARVRVSGILSVLFLHVSSMCVELSASESESEVDRGTSDDASSEDGTEEQEDPEEKEIAPRASVSVNGVMLSPCWICMFQWDMAVDAIPFRHSVNVDRPPQTIDSALEGVHVLVHWPDPHGWCLALIKRVSPKKRLNVRVEFKLGELCDMRFVCADVGERDAWLFRGGPDAPEHSWVIVTRE